MSTPVDKNGGIAKELDGIYGYELEIPGNIKSFRMLLECFSAGFKDSWAVNSSLKLPRMRWTEMAAKRFTFGLWVSGSIQYMEVSENDDVATIRQLIASGTLLDTVHSVKLGGD